MARYRIMYWKHIPQSLTVEGDGRTIKKQLSQKIQDKIDASGAWELDRKIEIAMDALRLPAGDADVSKLSGGTSGWGSEPTRVGMPWRCVAWHAAKALKSRPTTSQPRAFMRAAYQPEPQPTSRSRPAPRYGIAVNDSADGPKKGAARRASSRSARCRTGPG